MVTGDGMAKGHLDRYLRLDNLFLWGLWYTLAPSLASSHEIPGAPL